MGYRLGPRPVTISAPAGFAGLWLLPRMGHFQQLHPDIDLRISATARIVDVRSEGIDLAIRYCPASTAPKGAVRLFGETIVPVAHPSLHNGGCLRSLLSPIDIFRVRDP